MATAAAVTATSGSGLLGGRDGNGHRRGRRGRGSGASRGVDDHEVDAHARGARRGVERAHADGLEPPLVHSRATERLDHVARALRRETHVVSLVAALIVLIVVHLITARISDAILDSRVGMIDRILGFAFGVARGFILIVIPLMFYEAFQPDENQHLKWIKEARTLPYLKATGNFIRTVLIQYAPSSLTAPPPPPTGEQQGFLNGQRPLVALAIGEKRYYMTGSWRG